jgi:hypothetical protein
MRDEFEKIENAALQTSGMCRFGGLSPHSIRRRIRLAINLLQPMPATIQQL